MLVLGLDADKQLSDETPGAELVSCKRREERVLPIERRRHVTVVSQQRAVIMVAPIRSHRAEPEARLIAPCLA